MKLSFAVASLLGLAQGVQMNEEMKIKGQIAMSNHMHHLCKQVSGIAHPKYESHTLLQLEQFEGTPSHGLVSEGAKEPTTTPTEPAPKTTEAEVVEPERQTAITGLPSSAPTTTSSAAGEATEPTTTRSAPIQGTYSEHFGKTKEEVDAENARILDTQKKCLQFVKEHQAHPAICEWCQKEYQKPQHVWKWNPEEETWYKWYDGSWHYWGPSKDGFTEGWTYYSGYWHYDGYAYKYHDNEWYRFEDGQWVKYGETVPVKPEPPTGGKICRPFYKMMEQGFPQSLASTQVPRCKVGDHIYMWTDDEGCNFLGGTKIYEDLVVCKSGESHKWRRVVKCVQGGHPLESGGLDYSTGELHQNLYRFRQCGMYKSASSSEKYLYLFGEMKLIPQGDVSLFIANPHVTTVSNEQLNSATQGQGLSPGATIVSAQGGSHFLNSYKLMQFESDAVFGACQFNPAGVQAMSDTDYVKAQIGDIITL